MNLKNSVFIALAIAFVNPAAPAAEVVWPKSSAADLSIFVTALKFRIHADHCSDKVPLLKPEFENLMEDLASRIQGISQGFLASGRFREMKNKPVAAEIVDALKDSFNDARHNFERRDAASVCPGTLQNLGEMDDEALRSDLTETLTAIQSMTRNLEKGSAR